MSALLEPAPVLEVVETEQDRLLQVVADSSLDLTNATRLITGAEMSRVERAKLAEVLFRVSDQLRRKSLALLEMEGDGR